MASKKILRKITLKDVVGGKIDVRTLPTDGSTLPLAIIYGTAIDFANKTAPMGDYLLFAGQFKARALGGKNLGTEFVSGKLILPGIAQDLLAGRLDGSAVDFAFRMGVHHDETSVTSYVYDIEPAMDHGESAAMSAIEQRLGLVTLPAPAPAAESVNKETGETAAPAAPAKGKGK
jgi:hypothetical protein